MNDAQSTISGLKAQSCPGGGWNGMPAEIRERGATVADCLADGSCGCIYGDAVQHIERLTAALAAERERCAKIAEVCEIRVDDAWQIGRARKDIARAIRAAVTGEQKARETGG